MDKGCLNLKYFIPTDHRKLNMPLAIPGAEPGDVLEIRLKSLPPGNSALGYAAVLPFKQVRPLPAGNYGGSLLPAPLYPGNSLYLPVFLPGAGLILGQPIKAEQSPVNDAHKPTVIDAHKTSTTHIEAEIQVEFWGDFPLQRPRLENPFCWSFLSCHSRPSQALSLAWQDVLTHLQSTRYCSLEKARVQAAACAQVKFYAIPALPATTACICLPKSILRQL